MSIYRLLFSMRNIDKRIVHHVYAADGSEAILKAKGIAFDANIRSLDVDITISEMDPADCADLAGLVL